MLERLYRIFTSLRLTVALLGLGLVLVFWGTLAQVHRGLYDVQGEFFRSFLIYWGPKGASWKIPVFPGGYLIGGVLLLNLIASQLRRFSFSASKTGLWMVHVGLILLLLGQLLTDLLSRESSLHLREGETRNYSETEREAELAVIDATDPNSDKVVAISQGVLAREKSIRPGDLPFTIQVKQFFGNSVVQNRVAGSATPAAATQGIGPRAIVQGVPRVTEMDKRDVPSAVVEIETPQGSLGTWLVSEYVEQPQAFTCNNRTYQIALRPRRHYKPYSIQLVKFEHDVYPGTDIPKNFSSLVQVVNPSQRESREVLIYMNQPLRYEGKTFYQASFGKNDTLSVLSVVENPGWLLPYVSCVLVSLGLLVHFAIVLRRSLKRRQDKKEG